MSAVKLINTVGRLYEARDAVKQIIGSNYESYVETAKDIVSVKSSSEKVSNLSAAVELSKQYNAKGLRITGLLFLAAAVELNEMEEKGKA